MKFGITARLAVLASGLVLLVTGVMGWVLVGKANQAMTEQALERLGDDTCRLGSRV